MNGDDTIYDADKKNLDEKPATSKALKFSLSDWFEKNLTSIITLIFTILWFSAIPNIATWLIPKLRGTPWCLLVTAIFYPLVIAVINNLFFENMEKGKKGNAVMLITVIMIIVPLLQVITSPNLVKPVSRPPAASSTGKTFKVTVVAGESPYKIDKVVTGQTISYLFADGEFSTRINKGDGRACWSKKTPNTSYTADWDGTLEAITENKTPVTFTVNIT